jgi:uncharacterized protein
VKIKVQVKTRAKKNFCEKVSDFHYKISVVDPALENKANLRVVEVLSNFLKVPKSKIILTSGKKFKEKVFEIIK